MICIRMASGDVRTKKGGIVTISLDSNPSTGNEWLAEFDPKFLKLVRREYCPSSNLMGSGGVERFEFKALRRGAITIRIVYKRAWESIFSDERTYTVHIT